MLEEKKYYIYEWYNVDSGKVFYIGKGRSNRYKIITNRNKYFTHYRKKYNCEVRIILSGLSENEAYDKEISLISERKKMGECFTNLTDGGESGPSLPGKLNPNYGKKHSQDIRDKISKIHRESGRFKKEGNSQWGISPKDRMDEKTYNEWRQKQIDNKIGSKNPNYGNKKLSRFYKDNPDISREKNSRPGIKNGRATPIAMYNDNGFYKEFAYMTLCAEYIKELGLSKAKDIEGIVFRISSAAKNGNISYKHNYKFLK